MNKMHSNNKGGTPMTIGRAAAIQSATALANGGKVASGSFTARAQSAAANNVASGPAAGSASSDSSKAGR